MKAKIDLEKFICSLMKRFYKIHNIDPLTTKCWLDKVLEDQGLEYRDGEIVEIPQDSEDERIKKEILDLVSISGNGNQFEEIKDWLEKLGYKPQGKTALEAAKEEKSPVESLGISPEEYEEIVNECIYGKTISDDKKKLASSAKTCKNDTLLDLLNKMPSCITVDGIDYHFIMKKTSIYIAYYACYKGNGEDGRGNAIFGITAFSPIELLTAMLEKLKKEGL